MALCLAAGALSATLAVNAFTLAWTHSIEKVRWEEDWRIEKQHLVITEARIRGSGAGMEPPPDAQLHNGSWHYRPPLAPLTELRLTHSPYVPAYDICVDRACQPLTEILPGLTAPAVVEMRPCAE